MRPCLMGFTRDMNTNRALAPLTAHHHALMMSEAPLAKRDAKRDDGVKAMLVALQGDKCADCGAGREVEGRGDLEFAHFIKSQGCITSDGIVLGAMCCRKCNLVHSAVLVVMGLSPADILPFEYVERFNVLPARSVTRTDCVNAKIAKDADSFDYIAEAKRRCGM